MSLSPPPEFPGFQVLRLLGQGGAGAVYLAQNAAGAKAAIKTVVVEASANQETVLRRFSREIRALARLEHPNVIRILAADPEGQPPWCALEYHPGGDLAGRIASRGPLPIEEVLALGVQLCAGVASAHEAGILHRDLKPENVLFAEDGRVVVTDFGLSRDQSREVSVQLSLSGTLQGTPGYWSPEQASGEGKKATKEVDVYGIGAVLYGALTGHPPIVGASLMEVVIATLDRPPEKIRDLRPEVPRALEKVVLRCLAKDPARRYKSAEDVMRAILRVKDGDPPSAAERGAKVAPRRKASRRHQAQRSERSGREAPNPRRWAFGLACALYLIAGFLYSLPWTWPRLAVELAYARDELIWRPLTKAIPGFHRASDPWARAWYRTAFPFNGREGVASRGPLVGDPEDDMVVYRRLPPVFIAWLHWTVPGFLAWVIAFRLARGDPRRGSPGSEVKWILLVGLLPALWVLAQIEPGPVRKFVLRPITYDLWGRRDWERGARYLGWTLAIGAFALAYALTWIRYSSADDD